jgi:hypothetical protein
VVRIMVVVNALGIEIVRRTVVGKEPLGLEWIGTAWSTRDDLSIGCVRATDTGSMMITAKTPVPMHSLTGMRRPGQATGGAA